MDTIEDISLSKIATIIDNQMIIRTHDNSKWDRILSNAGQSKLFTKYEYALTPISFNKSNGTLYENKNPQFSGFYSAIKAILNEVYNNGQNSEAFTNLIGSIVEEIDIVDILNEDLQEDLQRRNRYNNPLKYVLEASDEDGNLEIINKEARKEYHEMVHNLHILNLDIGYSDYKLVLKPFTNQGSKELGRNPSLLMKWLETDFPVIALSYKEALETYTKGNAVSCISACRNIITGIFDDSKDDTTKWLKGLQKLSTDTYIENVDDPKHILSRPAKLNQELGAHHVPFKFPRFNMVNRLYSLSSDLGPHINEGPRIDGVTYVERTTMNDALWILRMTEDLLIWIKERQRQKSEIE
ncbi:hypothetical protein [Priestia endophytica]|uniref:hypothetical protein n=1 Tax=Priestia endophytica TaxID=135735 RepID=UPI00227E0416|nr:hypothetical protein [Priestia endophytica]MCY8234918.1 hypothetical protein [Priestia endophytica]